MRAPRALAASLGASLCLVLAGSLALAAISTVVAFRGWPGVGSGRQLTAQPRLIVAAAPTTTRARQVSLRMPRPRQHAPARSHARPAIRRARTPVAHAIVRRDRAAAPTTQAHPAAASTGATLATTGAAVAKRHPSQPTDVVTQPVRKVGNDLGGVVTGVGQGLADTVSQVSPPLGKTVGRVTTALGETVAATTKLVADIVDTLVRPK